MGTPLSKGGAAAVAMAPYVAPAASFIVRSQPCKRPAYAGRQRRLLQGGAIAALILASSYLKDSEMSCRADVLPQLNHHAIGRNEAGGATASAESMW